MSLLLLGISACSAPAPAAEAPCWDPPIVSDGLGESPAGLTVAYTYAETVYCEVSEGTRSHVLLRRYDAAERIDRVVFERSYDHRYDRREVWESDVCASSSVMDFHWPGAYGTQTTRTTCVDGWPTSSVTNVVATGGGETWEETSYAGWTYQWEEGLPVRIEAASGASPDALVVTSTEERDYLWDGRLTHVRTVTDTGSWGETLYTWDDDRLVGEAYVSAHGSRAETWSYDAEGRLAGWWSSEGPEAGTYVYVEGTRRIAAEYVDRAVDGVLDGVPDYFVGYSWSAEE